MCGGQEVTVQAGWAQAVHGDGEAVRWRRRSQRSLQLRLREELLPVLQVGRVHLQEGRAARVARLQHGCPPAAGRRDQTGRAVNHQHHNTHRGTFKRSGQDVDKYGTHRGSNLFTQTQDAQQLCQIHYTQSRFLLLLQVLAL